MPEEDLFNDEVDVAVDSPDNVTVNEYRSSITVGEVETLDYGEDAYVTNVGTESDVILDFGLPRGAAGSDWGLIGGDLSDQTDLQAALDAKDTAIAAKADANNATLTGTPTAPTAIDGTSTTQIATTAFVQNAIVILKNYINSVVVSMLKAPNFEAAVILSAQQQHDGYTPDVDGYLLLRRTMAASSTTDIATCTVAGISVYQNTKASSSVVHVDNFWVPVPAGQQIKTNATYEGSGIHRVLVSHFTQVMFVPFK